MLRTCQRVLKPNELQKCSSFFRSRSLSDKTDDCEKEYVPPGGDYRNPLKMLKQEVQAFKKGKIQSLENLVPRQTDVLIIGGGIVGSAAAFFIKNKGPQGIDVTVVERDHCYTRASTMLSVGGIRHQFTLPENVQMSMYMTEFLRNVKEHLSVLGDDPPEVLFHHQGYLFLSPEERAETLQECVKMQRELGAKTEFLTKNQLQSRFPWMNLEGVECGSYGLEGEGWFDPWQLVRALRRKNINLGVHYVDGEVTNFRFKTTYYIDGEERKERPVIRGVDVRHATGQVFGCDFSSCVNAAGPWAGEVAKMAGIGTGADDLSIQLPVEPRKRFVYVCHCPDAPIVDVGLTVDTSGAYFRREGLSGHYVCGSSPLSEEEEPDNSNLDVDYDFYQDFVWPAISYRVPAFENSKLKSAWAGFYDYNYVDQNLIIGPHPYHNKMFLANGMSGHGVQQGIAIGRAISELVYYSEYKAIDLSRFSFNRFLQDEPIKEMAIV